MNAASHPPRTDRQLSFSIYPEGGGSSIARDTAMLTVSESETTTGGQGPGFGIGAAITEVAGALYVIQRRFE
jgi:hypothetical protein